jgi:hypothetical protein
VLMPAERNCIKFGAAFAAAMQPSMSTSGDGSQL